MHLDWKKTYANGALITLDGVDLSTVKAGGVYVIYLAGNPPTTVYVGKGDVSARLGSHRNDARFKAARAKGTLCVAFASVAAADQEGVEKYLATRLPPVVGERHPESVREIAVNSPFAA